MQQGLIISPHMVIWPGDLSLLIVLQLADSRLMKSIVAF